MRLTKQFMRSFKGWWMKVGKRKVMKCLRGIMARINQGMSQFSL